MDRNRIILKTFEYWQSKLKGFRLPSRSDIVPGELRDLLPFLFTAEASMLNPTGCAITLRLTGSHIVRSLGTDFTGFPVGGKAKHWEDFVVGRDFFDAANQHCAIVSSHLLQRPPQAGALAPHLNSGALLRYHRLVLPLSSDGRRVDRLIGALVADTSENAGAIWQGPFMFEEHNKKILSDPFQVATRNIMETREPLAPA